MVPACVYRPTIASLCNKPCTAATAPSSALLRTSQAVSHRLVGSSPVTQCQKYEEHARLYTSAYQQAGLNTMCSTPQAPQIQRILNTHSYESEVYASTEFKT